MNSKRLWAIANKMIAWHKKEDLPYSIKVSDEYALIEFFNEAYFDRNIIEGLSKIGGRNYLTDYQVGISNEGINVVRLAIFKPDGQDIEKLEEGGLQ